MQDISIQPKIMQDRYAQLPTEVKELFEYGMVDQAIERIAAEFGLNEEAKSLLEMEIEMVLYLFITRDGFAERIQESLGVDKEKALGIAQKVSEDIFYTVDDILEFTEEQFVGTEETAVPLIVTPPTGQPVTDQPITNEVKADNATLVKPLRTFAMDVDMSRAHGYGAFQSDTGQSDEDEELVHSSNQDDILKK